MTSRTDRDQKASGPANFMGREAEKDQVRADDVLTVAEEQARILVERHETGGIRVRVVNPLAPPPSIASGGRRGIDGIRERVAALGGTVWVGPHEGRFLADVRLPWE